MEELGQIQNNLQQFSNAIPANHDPTEENAALNSHMKNMYGILSGLTNAISSLSQNNITKEDLNTVINPISEATIANSTRITALEEKTVGMTKTQDSFIPGMSKEIDQRLRKQNNVMIFNLCESDKTDNKDKKKHDETAIFELFKDTERGFDFATAVKTMFRVRKSKKMSEQSTSSESTNSKPKPLVVVFRDIKYKEKLF